VADLSGNFFLIKEINLSRKSIAFSLGVEFQPRQAGRNAHHLHTILNLRKKGER
jgi:hypothetical protein